MSVVSNNRRLRPEKVAPYFFISPFYIIFTIFFLLPTIASFILAFYKWKGVKAPKPRGWGNFEYLFFKDQNFWETFQNTVFYSAGSDVYAGQRIAVGIPPDALAVIHKPL